MLVTGANAAKVAEQVAKVNGVKRVLVAQDEKLKNNLPGEMGSLEQCVLRIDRARGPSNSRFPEAVQLLSHHRRILSFRSRNHSTRCRQTRSVSDF